LVSHTFMIILLISVCFGRYMMTVIPTFAVSTLVSFIYYNGVLLQCRTITFPLMCVEPIKHTECGPPIFWCADCKVEVDTMRAKMTFLWMSDLLLIQNVLIFSCTNHPLLF